MTTPTAPATDQNLATDQDLATDQGPPADQGLRPGEVTVTLPEKADAVLYFIGRIRTPWTQRKDCPKNARESRERGTVCTIEVDPRWSQALAGVEGCSHLIVLYWMDRARRDLVIQRPAHYDTGRATFALRSPVRPNPIALSVVKLLKVEGTRLEVIGLDCLDGTPLLDLKPYFASTDAIADAQVGWHAETKRQAAKRQDAERQDAERQDAKVQNTKARETSG